MAHLATVERRAIEGLAVENAVEWQKVHEAIRVAEWQRHQKLIALADKEGVGRDDAGDCLRNLMATKSREVRVRKLRGCRDFGFRICEWQIGSGKQGNN